MGPSSLAAALLLAGLANPPSPSPVAEARRAFDSGRYEAGSALLAARIAADPSDPEAHYWLARCDYELARYDDAAREAERAIALDPGSSVYHQWMGRIQGARAEKAGWFSAFGLARKVRQEFEAAVKLDPRNLRAERDLIEFYSRAPGLVGGGDPKAWRQAASLAKIDDVEGSLAEAGLWLDEGQPTRAAAVYASILARRPGRIGPYLEAADFYESHRDARGLENAVEGAAAVEPSNPLLDYYRGIAAFLQGRRDEDAARLLQAYITNVPLQSEFPSHAAAHEWLGRVYENQGLKSQAAAEYRAALTLEPGRKSARAALDHVER